MTSPSRPVDSRPSIAVAGATGQVGRALLELLLADPVNVVALTRCPDEAGLPSKIATAAIDFAQSESLIAALQGSDRLFLAHGSSEQQVANEIALIDAAMAAGIGHIVKLSALGPPSQLNPYAWHMRIEAYLASKPVAATVLRPSPFLDILKEAGVDIGRGAWAGAAGQGKTNFIDTRDIAGVARVVLLRDITTRPNIAYHLTGPRAWSMQEVAVELSSLLGRSIIYHPKSLDQQHHALLAKGLSPLVVDLLTGLDRLFAASALAETTTTVEAITGQAPRSLPDWLTENRALFKTSRS